MNSPVPDAALIRDSLIKRAETVLRPSLAILLECAFEAERNEGAAAFLEGLIRRFYDCAEKGLPLRDDDFEAFDIFLPGPTGSDDLISVGLLSAETISRESVECCDMKPETDGFVKYVSRRALEAGLSEIAPILLGVGIADNAQEAGLLSRLALFRSPDMHSPDERTRECERRILAVINNEGPGAGGLGGGHSALAVAIEHTGSGYLALCPGDYFTRFASKKL